MAPLTVRKSPSALLQTDHGRGQCFQPSDVAKGFGIGATSVSVPDPGKDRGALTEVEDFKAFSWGDRRAPG